MSIQHHQIIKFVNTNFFFLIPIILFLIIRIFLFDISQVPYGYDSGMYKDLFEQNSLTLEKSNIIQEHWAEKKHFIGISYITHLLFKTGISSDFLLKYGFLIFEILLIFSIYLFTKKFFNLNTAKITTIIYTLTSNSIYPYFYAHYKVIIAITILLCSFYFLKNKNYIFFLIFGCFLSVFHKQTFFLFALTYLIYFLTNIKNKENKKLFIIGLLFIISFITFNFKTIITQITTLKSILKTEVINSLNTGNYISQELFLQNIFFVIPLIILGIYYYTKKEKITNQLPTILLIILLLAIILKFFFYIRWLAFLNIILIIFLSYGIYKFSTFKININFKIITLLILFLLNLIYLNTTLNSINKYITTDELNQIKQIDNLLENNSKIYINSKYYLPWILGWTNSTLISNYDFNTINISENIWNNYYSGNISAINPYLDNKSYIYIGKYGVINKYNYNQINSKQTQCFKIIKENENSLLLRFIC